jgi:hypothetical protein
MTSYKQKVIRGRRGSPMVIGYLPFTYKNSKPTAQRLTQTF